MYHYNNSIESINTLCARMDIFNNHYRKIHYDICYDAQDYEPNCNDHYHSSELEKECSYNDNQSNYSDANN